MMETMLTLPTRSLVRATFSVPARVIFTSVLKVAAASKMTPDEAAVPKLGVFASSSTNIQLLVPSQTLKSPVSAPSPALMSKLALVRSITKAPVPEVTAIDWPASYACWRVLAPAAPIQSVQAAF